MYLRVRVSIGEVMDLNVEHSVCTSVYVEFVGVHAPPTTIHPCPSPAFCLQCSHAISTLCLQPLFLHPSFAIGCTALPLLLYAPLCLPRPCTLLGWEPSSSVSFPGRQREGETGTGPGENKTLGRRRVAELFEGDVCERSDGVPVREE